MYQGQFQESFTSKYGHGIKVNTERGEWKLFAKGAAPQFAPGTVVQFDAEKKGQSWAYSALRVAGAAPMPVQHPPGPAPVAQPAAPQPTPQGAATPVNTDKERDMFITGVVGRAMSSGQFSTNDVTILTLAADEAWATLLAKRAGKLAPANSGPIGPEPPPF